MKNNILPEITNWKLREIIDYVKIVDNDSTDFKQSIIEKFHFPISSELTISTISQSDLNWAKMNDHFNFFFDREGWEDKIKKAFESSQLRNYKRLIITYGWKEPTVSIPMEIFFENWEDFIASTQYETLMFSEDYKLVMEVSRDYHLHSNFFILSDVSK